MRKNNAADTSQKSPLESFLEQIKALEDHFQRMRVSAENELAAGSLGPALADINQALESIIQAIGALSLPNPDDEWDSANDAVRAQQRDYVEQVKQLTQQRSQALHQAEQAQLLTAAQEALQELSEFKVLCQMAFQEEAGKLSNSKVEQARRLEAELANTAKRALQELEQVRRAGIDLLKEDEEAHQLRMRALYERMVEINRLLKLLQDKQDKDKKKRSHRSKFFGVDNVTHDHFIQSIPSLLKEEAFDVISSCEQIHYKTGKVLATVQEEDVDTNEKANRAVNALKQNARHHPVNFYRLKLKHVEPEQQEIIYWVKPEPISSHSFMSEMTSHHRHECDLGEKPSLKKMLEGIRFLAAVGHKKIDLTQVSSEQKLNIPAYGLLSLLQIADAYSRAIGLVVDKPQRVPLYPLRLGEALEEQTKEYLSPPVDVDMDADDDTDNDIV